MGEPGASAPCYACGYHAAGAVRCPECGADLSAEAFLRWDIERWRWRWSDKVLAVAAVLVQVSGSGAVMWMERLEYPPHWYTQLPGLTSLLPMLASLALGVACGFRVLRRRRNTAHAAAWCVPFGLMLAVVVPFWIGLAILIVRLPFSSW